METNPFEVHSKFREYLFFALVTLCAAAVTFAILHFTKTNKLPRPPLVPLVRSSHTGIGYVLMLVNESDRPLGRIDLFVTDPSEGTRTSHTVPGIRPRETVEVGWLESGWVFGQDQTLALEVEGYERLEGTIGEIIKAQEEWYDSKFQIQSGK